MPCHGAPGRFVESAVAPSGGLKTIVIRKPGARAPGYGAGAPSGGLVAVVVSGAMRRPGGGGHGRCRAIRLGRLYGIFVDCGAG